MASKVIYGKIDAPFAFKKIFENPPRFVRIIVNFRDWVFSLFGLKTTELSNPIKFIDLPVDRSHPLVSEMSMCLNTPEEVIWGINDKHLNFAVSVFVINNQLDPERNQCAVFVSTALTYNNIWGRVYFALIRLIHAYVVKSMLKTMMEKL